MAYPLDSNPLTAEISVSVLPLVQLPTFGINSPTRAWAKTFNGGLFPASQRSGVLAFSVLPKDLLPQRQFPGVREWRGGFDIRIATVTQGWHLAE